MAPNDIRVVFDYDSVRGGFRKAETAGGYAVRYAAPGFAKPIDTVRQKRGGADFYWGYVSLRTLPWPTAPASSDLGSYSFRFVLPAVARTYDFTDIELEAGPSGGDGCCNCGENKRRRFLLNGVSVVADGYAYDGLGAVLQR
jgi:hypothetical protein